MPVLSFVPSACNDHKQKPGNALNASTAFRWNKVQQTKIQPKCTTACGDSGLIRTSSPVLPAPTQFSTTENENLSVFKKLQYSDNNLTKVRVFVFVDYFPQEILDPFTEDFCVCRKKKAQVKLDPNGISGTWPGSRVEHYLVQAPCTHVSKCGLTPKAQCRLLQNLPALPGRDPHAPLASWKYLIVSR